jgi:ABC-type nitrate/sulfonate/bicarbonate transport system, ATPase component
MQTAPDIVLAGINLDFDGQPLFADLNLTLPGGRTTCILGPSGCGKSTLLKLMAGSPNLDFTGRIRFEPTTDSQVAWMSQNDLLLSWLTLLDNVLLGARLRGTLSHEKTRQGPGPDPEAGLAGYEDKLPPPCPGACASAGRSCARSWKSGPSSSWTSPSPLSMP